MNEKNFVEQIQIFSKDLDIDIVKKILVFDEVSSTNIKCKELAQNSEPEGTIVVSQIQKKVVEDLIESGIHLRVVFIFQLSCNPNVNPARQRSFHCLPRFQYVKQ